MKSEMKFNFEHLFEFVKLEIITMITFTEEILNGKRPFLSSINPIWRMKSFS